MAFVVQHKRRKDPHKAVALDPRRVGRRVCIRDYFEGHMRRRDWNLTMMSHKVGCDRSYMSRIISGDRTPSLDTTCHLARVLDVELQDIADLFVGQWERIREIQLREAA